MELELMNLFRTNRKYSFSEICRHLKDYEKEDIKRTLENLELNGSILFSCDKYQIFPNNFKLVHIKIDKNGCGYFYIGEKKYNIKQKYLNGCLDGDLCAVNMDGMNVSKIIKRKTNLLLCEFNNGAISINNNQNYNVIISDSDIKKLVDGSIILVRINDNNDNDFYCSLVEVIGHVNDPDIELKKIAISKSFDINFSKEAIKEADEIPTEVVSEDLENRLDLRNELIYTIDCDDTKDMDDAISVKIKENGNYEVGIHIADVSHYVKYGSILFNEALKRGTSVYMVDTVIPMLMHKLSNGICSLNPNVDRLTLSCIVELDISGNVVSYDIKKSVINSKKKLNYSSVNKILMEGVCPLGYEEFVDNLKLANEISLLLSRKYNDKGYLHFGSSEIKYTSDQNIFEIRKSLAAEKIIENFMLLANKIIASHFEYLPFPFRIHEIPESSDVEKAFESLRKMGYNIPHVLNLNNPKVIQGILKNLYESGDFSLTSYFILKSMKKARYSPINVGHFGLSFDCYTHFTSPIRRFNDLLVHLIISSYLNCDEKTILDIDNDLNSMCEHISLQETLADEAEEEALRFKMAAYMEDYVGEYFNGKVIDLGPKYITVKLVNNIIGTVYLDDIKNGTYYFDNQTYSIRNKKSDISYKVGDYIRTQVIYVDKNCRKINLKITENLEHVKVKNLELKK